MIIGIGTDIVAVERIKHVVERNPRFVERIFTPQEIRYCSFKASSPQSFAARFAAKEALMKAMGTGWSGEMNWQDIEVIVDQAGKPEIKVYNATEKLLASMSVTHIHLSLSHEKDYALAYVILENQKA